MCGRCAVTVERARGCAILWRKLRWRTCGGGGLTQAVTLLTPISFLFLPWSVSARSASSIGKLHMTTHKHITFTKRASFCLHSAVYKRTTHDVNSPCNLKPYYTPSKSLPPLHIVRRYPRPRIQPFLPHQPQLLNNEALHPPRFTPHGSDRWLSHCAIRSHHTRDPATASRRQHNRLRERNRNRRRHTMGTSRHRT
jgi:hypothetical protein